MINYQTILSNYNKRGTLLKWLRTLQTALEEGALETVTTTTTDDSVVFHFGFADGTSVDSPPIQLEAGPPGTAATIEIGTVSTLPAGSDATVVNTGTTTDDVLDFGIPQGIAGQDGQDGQDGADGAAATIAVGTVSTLPAGSSATVTNSGTSSAAVFDFGIPQGANGDPGEVIEQIVPVETTTTASRPYAKDAYFVNNLGILVQATANIALGATIDSTNTTAANKTLSEALTDDMHGTFTEPAGLTAPSGITIVNSGKLKLGHIVIYELLLTGTPYAFTHQINNVIATGFESPAEIFLGSGVMNFYDYNNYLNSAHIVLNQSNLSLFGTASTDQTNNASVRGSLIYIV